MPRKPKKKVEEKKVEGGEEVQPEGEEKAPEEEEGEEQKKKPIFEKGIYPHSFIMLNCSEELIFNRYAKSGQKLSPMAFQEDLDLYNMLNMIDSCSLEENGQTVWNFIQEKKDEILTGEIRADTNFVELFEAVRIYVERNGRPYNFLESEGKILNAREMSLLAREKQDHVAAKHKQILEEEAVNNAKREREAKNKDRLKEILDHQEEIKEAQHISTRYS